MSKVAIVGDPSGTGTFTISAPNGNTDRTLVLPDEAGTVLTSVSDLSANALVGSLPVGLVTSTDMPAGSVIQVVQTAYSTVDSTASSTPVNTGCFATITPRSSSNKILATVNMPTWHASAGTQAFCRISRDNNAAISGLADDFYHPTGTGVAGNITISWLDSPATTSTVTYTVQFGSHTGTTVSINKDYYSNNNGVTYLTLMEVVA